MFSIFLTKIFAAIFDLNGSKGLGEKGICTKGVDHSKKTQRGGGGGGGGGVKFAQSAR